MGYLDRLKIIASEKCAPCELPKVPKAAYDSIGSSQGARFQKIEVPNPSLKVATEPDDRHACPTCANLRRAICTAASPTGPVFANRGYRPSAEFTALATWCEGYAPRPP